VSRGISLGGLRIEPLQVRVDRNRIRYVVFLAAFLTGSAALLTLVFVAVPGSLIGIVVDEPDYYSWLGVTVAAAFALLLVVGSLAAYSQVANAEHWVRSRFQSVDLDAGTYAGLHTAVEEISLAGGLPEPPRLLLLGVPSVNARAIGTSRKRPVIGVTRGFLDSLTTEEQQAVIATLIARITRGDILVATALTALMGPLKLLRDIKTVPKGVEGIADTGCGGGCGDGCGDPDGCGDLGDADGCGGALALVLFVIVVAALTWVAITVAAWLVTIWGRALHRTGHEKADAEGMLLLRHPQPMLSALRKAISSSNEVADGDPSYDGIFYASTSGTPAIDKVERRRYDRLREVLGTDGLAAPLPEADAEGAGKSEVAEKASEEKRLIDWMGRRSLLGLVPAATFDAAVTAVRAGAVKTLEWDADGLRSSVAGAEAHETKLWLEGGELQWSCTCGAAETALCEHLVASAVATWPRRPKKKRS
jgi:Zn-dependent protease with chaperone function